MLSELPLFLLHVQRATRDQLPPSEWAPVFDWTSISLTPTEWVGTYTYNIGIQLCIMHYTHLSSWNATILLVLVLLQYVCVPALVLRTSSAVQTNACRVGWVWGYSTPQAKFSTTWCPAMQHTWCTPTMAREYRQCAFCGRGISN